MNGVGALFSGSGLRARSMRSAGYTVFRVGAFKGLQLASNLILTRILFPEAFGLMALVTVFVGGLSMISDVGIRPAMIRSPRAEEAIFQSTTWTLQIVRGVVLMMLAFALAWPYAQIYDEPMIVPLVSVMAVTTLLAGFESIEVVLRERALNIGRVVAMHIGSKLFSVVITVFLAWQLQSVWALVWGAIAGGVFKTVMSHVLFPSPNHRLAWNKGVLSEILVFGRWIMLATLLTYMGGKGLQAVQGALVDLETLAFLVIADQFGWMIGELALAVLTGVAFPALSQIYRERREDFARAVVRIHRLQILCTLPAFLVLSIIAEPLIGVLYDARYVSAGFYLSLIALNGAIAMVPMVFSNMLLATGDSRTYSALAGASAVVRILGTVVGFLIGDVTGLLVGLGLASLVTTALTVSIAMRRNISDLKTVLPALGIIVLVYALQLKGFM